MCILFSLFYSYMFTSLQKLEFLDLKNNRLKHIEMDAFITLTSLKAVNFANNTLTFCDTPVMDMFGKRSPLRRCRMLEDIQLANNSLTDICVDWKLSMNNLKIVNLAYNKISQIRVRKLYTKLQPSSCWCVLY